MEAFINWESGHINNLWNKWAKKDAVSAWKKLLTMEIKLVKIKVESIGGFRQL
jgi:hypothetical protein